MSKEANQCGVRLFAFILVMVPHKSDEMGGLSSMVIFVVAGAEGRCRSTCATKRHGAEAGTTPLHGRSRRSRRG